MPVDRDIDTSFNPVEDVEELRSFRDPIWDLIQFNKFACSFIDTPQFQRLRYLKQLGVSYFVFPGASHNRFEHSLGTAYLARKLVVHLKERQPSLGINDRDIECVEIAGLCHDLGHGPFSHVFDSHFIPRVKGNQRSWSHEEASEMMLDALIKENGIKISTDKVEFIKDLIQGESRLSLHHDPPEKPFLFEIVANKANGIDVDKWDYLARDSKMVGETCPLVATRLLEAARVVDGRIAYNWKDSHSINELFYARYSLHKKIYNHKVARAIEHMIVEALIAAEPVYHMADKIDDPSEYLLLTDSILEEIERSKDPRLEESRRIIRDLRRRKIPHRVEEKCVHADYRSLWKERLTPAAVAAMAREIAGHTNPNFKEILPRTKLSDGETTSADTVITDVASPTTDVATPDPIPGTPASMIPDTPDDSNEEEDFSNVPVTEKDVIVDFCLLHYGMKEKDPLGLVPCYGKNDPYHCSFIRPSESGSLKPRNFQELVVRCYARHRSQGKIIQAAFRKVMEKLPVIEDESNVASIVADRSSTPLAIQSPGSSFTVVDAPITPKPTKVEKVNSEVTAPNTFMTVTRSGGSPRRKSNKRKEEDREFPAEPDSPLRKRSKR